MPIWNARMNIFILKILKWECFPLCKMKQLLLPSSISANLTSVSAPKWNPCSWNIVNNSSTCSSEFCGRTTNTSPGCQLMWSLLKLINRTSCKWCSAVVRALLYEISHLNSLPINIITNITYNDCCFEGSPIENGISVIFVNVIEFIRFRVLIRFNGFDGQEFFLGNWIYIANSRSKRLNC